MQEKSIEQLERIAKDTAFYSPERRYEALVELDRRNALRDEFQPFLSPVSSSPIKRTLTSHYKT